MKELSIEEKAKRYDSAIEKFDVILNLNTVKENGTIFADDVRKIFPELAESEGERIRKELLAVIDDLILPDEQKERFAAWLEKQGKRNTDNSIWHKVEPKEYVLEKTLICKENGEIDLVEDTILSVTGAKYALPVSFLGIPKSFEKQGDHANFISKIQVGDKVTRNEDGVLVNLSQLNRVAKKEYEMKEIIPEDATVDSNEDGLIAETIRYKNEK